MPQDFLGVSLAAFLAGGRIRRRTIGGDALLERRTGSLPTDILGVRGLYNFSHARVEGFARRCMAPLFASRLVVALVRQAASEKLMRLCSAHFLGGIRLGHAVVEDTLGILAAMPLAITGVGRVIAKGGDQIDGPAVDKNRPRRAADQFFISRIPRACSADPDRSRSSQQQDKPIRSHKPHSVT